MAASYDAGNITKPKGYLTHAFSSLSTQPSVDSDAWLSLADGANRIMRRNKVESFAWRKGATTGVDAAGVVFMGALHNVLIKFLTIAVSNYPTALTLHAVFWVSRSRVGGG